MARASGGLNDINSLSWGHKRKRSFLTIPVCFNMYKWGGGAKLEEGGGGGAKLEGGGGGASKDLKGNKRKICQFCLIFDEPFILFRTSSCYILIKVKF